MVYAKSDALYTMMTFLYFEHQDRGLSKEDYKDGLEVLADSLETDGLLDEADSVRHLARGCAIPHR